MLYCACLQSSYTKVLYKHQPTLSADIWSTLCVFVEMLTAKLPGCYEFLRNQNSMFYLVSKCAWVHL